jgi:hypothetical protein
MMKNLPNKSVRSIIAVGIFLAAGVIHAEGTIVRQVMKNGTVLYTDHPVPGVKIDARIVVPDSPVGRPWMANPSMDGRTPGKDRIIAPPDVTATLGAPSQPISEASQLGRNGEIAQAQARLDNALSIKQNGAEAQPSERTGTANHTSRLNELFDVRQEKLDQDIKNAREALERARELSR